MDYSKEANENLKHIKRYLKAESSAIKSSFKSIHAGESFYQKNLVYKKGGKRINSLENLQTVDLQGTYPALQTIMQGKGEK